MTEPSAAQSAQPPRDAPAPRARRGCMGAAVTAVLLVIGAVVIVVAVAVVFGEHNLDRPQFIGTTPRVVGRVPAVGPPPNALPIDVAVRGRVADSVVRVSGIACQEIQQGSGFVVGPGLVVTDAHVVAGERATTVIDHRGRRITATVVRFDPVLDLALLRLDGVTTLPALPLTAPRAPADLAVFGHPGGGSLRIAPAGLSPAGVFDAVQNRDIYGRPAPGTRKLLALATRLAPGDSGAPVVDSEARVVAVAFAIDPNGKPIAYALTSPQVAAFVTPATAGPVATGRCISL